MNDNCSEQNKNIYILSLLLHIHLLTELKIEVIYPIRGHSYMAADRAFAQVENVLKNKKKCWM